MRRSSAIWIIAHPPCPLDVLQQTGALHFRNSWCALAIVGVMTGAGGCAATPPASDPPPTWQSCRPMLSSGSSLRKATPTPGEPVRGGRDTHASGCTSGDGQNWNQGVLWRGRCEVEGGTIPKNGKVTGSGVTGDSGWVSGSYTVVDASGATIDSGSYLSVHRRNDGEWPYIRDIWNSDRPAAAPAPAAPDKK